MSRSLRFAMSIAALLVVAVFIQLSAGFGRPGGSASAAALCSKSRTYLKSYRLERAEAYLNDAMRADPLNACTLSTLGALADMRGQLLTAEDYYRRTVNDDPSSARNLSRLLLEQGRLKESAEMAAWCLYMGWDKNNKCSNVFAASMGGLL